MNDEFYNAIKRIKKQKLVQQNPKEDKFVEMYLVEWKDGSKDSWVPSINITFPILRQFKMEQKQMWKDYEMNQLEPLQRKFYTKMLLEEDSVDRELREQFDELCRTSPVPLAFERRLPVRKIINAFEYRGKIMYVVAWKHINKVDIIPAKLCNVKIPQYVIRYLESKLWIVNMHGETIRWAEDEDEDFEWKTAPPEIIEKQKIDYSPLVSFEETYHSDEDSISEDAAHSDHFNDDDSESPDDEVHE